jgi:phosphatidate cytidylyltransferase
MKRILTAIVLILIVVAIAVRGEPWLVSIVAALVAGLAAFEYRALAHTSTSDHETDIYIPVWWLYPSIALLFFFTLRLPDFELPVLTLLTFILLAWSGFRAPLKGVLLNTALGLFGLIYVAYPLTVIPLIKAHEDGTGLLIFLFACVWCGDIAALYVGRNLGRHKLSTLSPNKTWEGSIASVAGSVGAGMTAYYLGTYLSERGYTVLHIDIPAWQMVLLAIILNVAAQLGDLLESAIKRGANVKDSGTLLPGHGGILDRIDALLLAAPVLWYVLLLRDWQTLFR